MASDPGADAELRERVAQLEETVAEQQHHSSESPEQPSASRRGFLSAAAAVAGLGALGAYSSYPASAQAAGQVGTSSEPVDVEAYDLNVQGSVSGIDTGGVENPLTADLDADGNSLTNLASVETTDMVADSVSTEQINTELSIKPSMSVSSIQSEIDSAGPNTYINFEAGGGAYSLAGQLELYDDSILDIQACDIEVNHSSGSVTGELFTNEDQTNGNENITVIAHSADIDGNRQDMAAGEDLHGVRLRGDAGSTNNTDNFAEDMAVLGGEWHDFRTRGVDLSRVIGGQIDVSEAHHNGEPGDTSQGGDGVSAAACENVSVRCKHSHDNERHGGTLRGTGSNRCINCELHIKLAENNGNDGLNCEECEGYKVTGTSKNDGMDGVHLNGTGNANVSVISPGNPPLIRVSDYDGVSSIIATDTGANSAIVDLVTKRTPAGVDGVNVTGGDGTKAVVDVVAEDIGRDAIFNDSVGELVVKNVVVEGCDRMVVNMGNDSFATVTVNGGRADQWDRGDNGFAAIRSGNNFGDNAVVSGLSLGPAGGSNSPAAVDINSGNYHVVVGNAFNGDVVTVNGTDSVAANNS
jgi:hypothetical protein